MQKRLGLAALSLIGSSWSSQPSFWLLLKVAWLDLIWHFSRGQPESGMLKCCHFLPCEWPSGLGQTHQNVSRHQKKFAREAMATCNDGRAVACITKLHNMVECLFCSDALCCFHKVKWYRGLIPGPEVRSSECLHLSYSLVWQGMGRNVSWKTDICMC